MKCVCGNPMRQHVVALDDIWLTCIICGRSKPAVIEKEKPRRPRVDENEARKRREHMSRTLSDLNNKLFEQLDRLSASGLTGDKLQTEIERTRAMSHLAKEIIENGKLALEAQRTLGGKKGNPKMLGVSE